MNSKLSKLTRVTLIVSIAIFVLSIIATVIGCQLTDGWTCLIIAWIIIPIGLGVLILAPLGAWLITNTKKRKTEKQQLETIVESDEEIPRKMKNKVRNALIIGVSLSSIAIVGAIFIFIFSSGGRTFGYILIGLGAILLILIPLITWYINKDIMSNH